MVLVQVNQQEFQVEVEYKRSNRNIYLRIRDGVIRITTPVKLSSTDITQMIQKNYNYIVKHMNVSSVIEDQVHYLGKLYRLEILSSAVNDVYVGGDKIVVSCVSPVVVGKLMQLLYIRTLKNVVERYSKEIFLKFSITKEVAFKYKDVKGYYGECFSKRNLIILSTQLAKYDLKYILSVIYHECAHFKYQNHQKEFYDYLESKFPNYRAVRREMREIKYNEKY